MEFDMPFDWDINRINKTNMFVHQEIAFPTSNDFASNRSYSATVNGIDVSKSVMLDNSNPKKDVIHIMLSKNQIIQIVDKLSKTGQPNTDLMKFVLKPGNRNNNINSMQQQHPMMSHGSMGSMISGNNNLLAQKNNACSGFSLMRNFTFSIFFL